MGLISTIRLMGRIVPPLCFALAIVFLFLAIASMNLTLVMIIFLAFTALSVSAGIYFRNQK